MAESETEILVIAFSDLPVRIQWIDRNGNVIKEIIVRADSVINELTEA